MAWTCSSHHVGSWWMTGTIKSRVIIFWSYRPSGRSPGGGLSRWFWGGNPLEFHPYHQKSIMCNQDYCTQTKELQSLPAPVECVANNSYCSKTLTHFSCLGKVGLQWQRDSRQLTLTWQLFWNLATARIFVKGKISRYKVSHYIKRLMVAAK